MEFNNIIYTFILKHETDESFFIIAKHEINLDVTSKDTAMSRFLNVLNDYKLNFKVINNTDKVFEVSFSEEINYNIVIDLYCKLNQSLACIEDINAIMYKHLSNDEQERLEQLKELWENSENNNYKYIYCISLVDGCTLTTFSNEKDMPCLVICHDKPCYTWCSIYNEDDEMILRITGSDVLLLEDDNKNGVIIDTQLELNKDMSIPKVIEYILDDIRLELTLNPDYNPFFNKQSNENQI